MSKAGKGGQPIVVTPKAFDVECTECPRLSQFLVDVKTKYEDFYCKPVPPFGDESARLMILGLAPGMKGANATGRPFTGDHAGILLYQTLHDFGFATKSESLSSDDDLVLNDCIITNAVKCLPPQNKPTTDEVKQCSQYLFYELQRMPANSVILALGKIAHDTLLRTLGLKLSAYPFAHGAEHQLETDDFSFWLVDSYHCSRYNTQTKRLTEPMFREVFAQLKERIG